MNKNLNGRMHAGTRFALAFTLACAAGFAQQAPVTRPNIPLFFEQQGTGFIATGSNYGLRVHAGAATLALNGTRIAIRPEGAREIVAGHAENPLGGHTNYYLGDNPKAWATGIPHYGRIRYREVYEGVDLVYYGVQGEVEFDFIVAPAADPGQVALTFDGVTNVTLDNNGDLLLQTPAGIIRQKKPIAYQHGEAGREQIAAAYRLTDNGAAFNLGPYDPSRELVIDPVLTYGSYIGGNGNDEIDGIRFDAAGNIYLSGINGSNTFPGGSQLTASIAGQDAFVMKLTPDARQVIYRTYVGGTGNDVAFIYLGLQQDGSAVITGLTEAANFPRMNAIQNGFGGGEADVFVTRLNPQGQMTFSTFLGGNNFEGPSDIAIDKDDNIYVAGWTASGNYPRVNPAQQQYGGGFEDGFLTKITPTGSAIVYSTFYGGSGDDFFNSMAVDANGSVYGSGYTDSANLPTTNGAYRTNSNGGEEAFAVKYNPAGSARVFSTYLGGSNDDWSVGMAIDTQGNMYVAGNTYSNNFPTTGIQTTLGGDRNTFLTKLNANGTGIVYSTLLGGASEEGVERVAVNSYNEAYVAGWTESANFPIFNAIQTQKSGTEDAFLFKVNAQGSALVYSTFVGGASEDIPLAIAIDKVGGLIAMGGYTEGGGFPTAAPVQAAWAGGDDAWLVLIEEAVGTSAASYVRGELAPESMGSVFGTGFTTQIATAATTPLPKVLAGASVTVTDAQGTEREAELFVATPQQINFIVPTGTAMGTAIVTVKTADGRLLRTTVKIVAVAPGIFSANASGQGVAAANIARYSGGNAIVEPAGKFDGTKFVPEPINMGAEGDQVYLILYGTGMRGANGVATATVGGQQVGVAGPVAQGQFAALDQMNLGPLPRTLIGKGEVNVATTVGGKTVNVLTVAFK